ncbi:HTH-type transcriptional regulator DmlR [Thalassocella blandensis]|nr:HTH-type transcriptional regulator DmlR [Thalassocella blandensis]
MSDLKAYIVFAETVQSGSMSEAGRRLGMSPSAISQTLRALEQHSGVTLLNRSTRRLSLTEAGERCYPHCLRVLEAANAVKTSLADSRDSPEGEIRISAPVGFAAHISAALFPLLNASPNLRLSLLLDDQMVDLIQNRVDIAVRVGKMADSTWISRRLTEIEGVLCASARYLERYGIPETIENLQHHRWIASAQEVIHTVRQGVSQSELMFDVFSSHGGNQRVHVAVNYASNNQIALHEMCEHGLGIAKLAYPDALDALERGNLVQILPQWHLSPLPVNAVTVKRDGEPAKIRLALDALKKHFATLPKM